MLESDPSRVIHHQVYNAREENWKKSTQRDRTSRIKAVDIRAGDHTTCPSDGLITCWQYNNVKWRLLHSRAVLVVFKKLMDETGITRHAPIRCYFFSFLFAVVTSPRRSLTLTLSDTRVYEPQIRARLGITAHSVLIACWQCHNFKFKLLHSRTVLVKKLMDETGSTRPVPMLFWSLSAV